MNIEDLRIYKQKIYSLDNLQQKQRDLYLRKISNGEVMGPMVGYPTIDKPWLKYMSEENVVKDVPVKNVYQEIYDNNKEYPNQLALMYFGAKVTYGQLFEGIDKATKALVANGIKKGDYITIYAVATPEIIYLFYAIARLGAVAFFLDPFVKKMVKERIEFCQSKLAIVMDTFYPSVHEMLEESAIEKMVILPALNSSPLRYIKKTIKADKSKNEIMWNKFIREGKNHNLPEKIPFEHDMPLVTVNSSGSTGVPKSIVLTHDSLENSVHAYPKCDVKTNRGDLMYQVIPPFASTGISTSVHMPLSQGGTLFMDPRFERKVFVKNSLKMNPVGTVAGTTLFQGFLDPECLSKKGNLSNYSLCFQGGEKVEIKDKIAIEEVFKKYNSNSKLMNGYGQCECGAGIATQTKHTPDNVSVGIPIPGVVIGIYDENRKEKQFDERGEILVNTPCGMKEYMDNPEATANYFYYDDCGIKWYCTGDMGVINTNGELTVAGRMSDYSIINGKKVYNFDIEDIIRSFDYIQNCDVFLDNNNELVAHIILKDNKKSIDKDVAINEMQMSILGRLFDLDFVPEKFKFRDSFPSQENCPKRDVAGMKAEQEGFIYQKMKMTQVKLA